MIFLHPLALAGIVSLAGPVIIHLLMRREAVRVPFPTLRFLQATRTSAARRHRLSDWPLLIVRLLILTVVVLALADPVWLRLARRVAAQRVSRAFVIDASGSMDRPAAGGDASLREIARRESGTLASRSFTSMVVEMPDLGAGVLAACDWLDRVPPSRREVVLFSDFQQRAFNPSTIACIPAGAGITLHALTGPDVSSFRGPRIVRGDSQLLSEVTASETGTDVAYVPTGETAAPMQVVVLGTDEERRAAGAAITAVVRTGTPVAASERAIVMVFRGAEERTTLDARVTSLTAPWMFDLVERVRRGVALSQIAAVSGHPDGSSLTCDRDARCTAVTASEGAAALAYAGADRDRLILFTTVQAASLETAALVQTVLSARVAFPFAEHDPLTWSASSLHDLERPAAEPPASQFRNEGAGAHRMLWIAALVVLAVETWMRRGRRPKAASVERHERVA